MPTMVTQPHSDDMHFWPRFRSVLLGVVPKSMRQPRTYLGRADSRMRCQATDSVRLRNSHKHHRSHETSFLTGCAWPAQFRLSKDRAPHLDAVWTQGKDGICPITALNAPKISAKGVAEERATDKLKAFASPHDLVTCCAKRQTSGGPVVPVGPTTHPAWGIA